MSTGELEAGRLPAAAAQPTLVISSPWRAVGICVYIEAVFRMPGLGFTTIQSMGGAGLDLPILVGITLFTGTVIIVLNLLVDLFAVAVDPTISRSPRAGRRLGSPVAARSNA